VFGRNPFQISTNIPVVSDSFVVSDTLIDMVINLMINNIRLLSFSCGLYECLSKSFQTEPITKYKLTTINTRSEATQGGYSGKTH
jgi:hypothetical protein